MGYDLIMKQHHPIRILHIVTYMGRGGLETMIMNYYRHVDRSKVQFDFLVHRDFEADYDSEILSLGGRIYHLPPLNPINRDYLSKLDGFFAAHPEYRIVHCHLDCMAGIPLHYAQRHGVPVRIAHAHSSSQTKDSKYLLKLLYKRSIPKKSTHLFACADAAGKWMFGTDDFQVLNNAIDAGSYAFDATERLSVRQELGIDEDAFVAGHVGRFMAPKNHEFLLRIFAHLPENARLLLVGDGELRQNTEKQADALGIRHRVIFTGLRSDVNRLLQAMDVFVFPSIYEGLPVSVIEAQAAGLPCLISDKVPIECRKTELVTQIPLDAGEEAWAAAAMSASETPRENTLNQIRTAGFDIQSNAAWLQSFYLNNYTHPEGSVTE